MAIITAELDYSSLLMEQITFQPGTSIMCLTISTISEDILEVNETFRALLETGDPDINLGLSTTTITIQNNDCKYYMASQFIQI